jgi:hypothetical protein
MSEEPVIQLAMGEPVALTVAVVGVAAPVSMALVPMQAPVAMELTE